MMQCGFAPPRAASALFARPRTALRATCRTRQRAACATLSLTPSQTQKLLNFALANQVDKALAQNVLALSERARREHVPLMTHFLPPLESCCLLHMVSAVRDVRAACWGGYEDAERRVLVVGSAYDVAEEQTLIDAANDALVVVKLEGEFDERTTHRHFMGAVLRSSGLERSRIGDIGVLRDARGAQLVTTADAARIVQRSVRDVRGSTVSASVLQLSQLEETARALKTVNSVEASLRLDAVGSSGLGVSRARFGRLLAKGLVSHNQRVCRSAHRGVQPRDTISARGVGKVRVCDVSRTKSGRFRVSMQRFV